MCIRDRLNSDKFNLIISKDSDLATMGSLSHRFKIGPKEQMNEEEKMITDDKVGYIRWIRSPQCWIQLSFFEKTDCEAGVRWRKNSSNSCSDELQIILRVKFEKIIFQNKFSTL